MKKKRKKLFKKYTFIALLSIIMLAMIVYCIASWNSFLTAAKVLLSYSIVCLPVIIYHIIKSK